MSSALSMPTSWNSVDASVLSPSTCPPRPHTHTHTQAQTQHIPTQTHRHMHRLRRRRRHRHTLYHQGYKASPPPAVSSAGCRRRPRKTAPAVGRCRRRMDRRIPTTPPPPPHPAHRRRAQFRGTPPICRRTNPVRTIHLPCEGGRSEPSRILRQRPASRARVSAAAQHRHRRTSPLATCKDEGSEWGGGGGKFALQPRPPSPPPTP